MIWAALIAILPIQDAWAPLDFSKLPSRPAVVAPLPSGKWHAEIRVRLAGPTEDDPVFTETWDEVGEVVGKEPLKIRLKRRLMGSTLDGQPIPPPDGDPLDWLETLGSSPAREPQFEDIAALRHARAVAFVHPRIAETKWPAEAESRVPSALAKFTSGPRRAYEFLGRTVVRATWTFVESPGIRATGEGLYDAETGVPCYTRIEASGVPLPGGDGTLYRLTWIRQIKP